LESTFQNGLNSLLCFRPCQRGRKGVEGVEEAVGGWQRDLVNKIPFAAAMAPRSNDAIRRAERVDEAVQPASGSARLTYRIVRQYPIEVVRAENDFKRATAADETGRRSVRPGGMHPTPTSGCPNRVFSRDAKRMSQASTNSLLTPRRSPDLRDATTET